MRELVFNEASCSEKLSTCAMALDMLVSISRGMALLVNQRLASSSLRLTRQFPDIEVALDGSLWDCLQMLRRNKQHREEALFWMRLAQKFPLHVDLSKETIDILSGAEHTTLDGLAGAALLLCARTSAIAVSFTHQACWDSDIISVSYSSLQPDCSLAMFQMDVDNIGRSEHAEKIISRIRRRGIENLSPAEFWQNRQILFPCLTFGLDIEHHISINGGNHFGTIVRKLAELDKAARDWLERKGPAPSWSSRVTPEADNVINNPTLAEHRVYRDAHGIRRMFMWHARYGNSGRIHFRFDRETFLVEVGYIGPHLPLG